jgi:hypothetical protein
MGAYVRFEVLYRVFDITLMVTIFTKIDRTRSTVPKDSTDKIICYGHLFTGKELPRSISNWLQLESGLKTSIRWIHHSYWLSSTNESPNKDPNRNLTTNWIHRFIAQVRQPSRPTSYQRFTNLWSCYRSDLPALDRSISNTFPRLIYEFRRSPLLKQSGTYTFGLTRKSQRVGWSSLR